MRVNLYAKKRLSMAGIALILMVSLMLGIAAGCAAPKEAVTVNIAALKGPSGMGMAHLFGAEASHYNMTLCSTPDEVAGRLISGEVDIAAVPINLAAVLYNKMDGKVSIIALNTLGVLYILENGDSIRSIADLTGKTIYATGQGATPEYILNYLLERNGVAGSVNIEYIGEHAELAALMAAGEIAVAMLPEPNVTAVLQKNPHLRVALDLTEEWAKVSDTELVQGCILARNEFIEANPQALMQFFADFESSVNEVNSDPEAAAKLIAEAGIMADAQTAKLAIPGSHIVFLRGEGAKAAAKAMLEVLYNANPKSVGGTMPGEGVYFLGSRE